MLYFELHDENGIVRRRSYSPTFCKDKKELKELLGKGYTITQVGERVGGSDGKIKEDNTLPADRQKEKSVGNVNNKKLRIQNSNGKSTKSKQTKNRRSRNNTRSV